jgi:putative FmdB family regulatory protein
MPLYHFYCKKCEKNFETFLRLSETHKEMTCPFCQEKEVEGPYENRQDALTPGVCGAKKDT